jgi:hypothetical protein
MFFVACSLSRVIIVSREFHKGCAHFAKNVTEAKIKRQFVGSAVSLFVQMCGTMNALQGFKGFQVT